MAQWQRIHLPLPASARGTEVQSLGWDDPLEKEMAIHFSICLGNPMDRGVSWATVHGVAKKSDMI